VENAAADRKGRKISSLISVRVKLVECLSTSS